MAPGAFQHYPEDDDQVAVVFDEGENSLQAEELSVRSITRWLMHPSAWKSDSQKFRAYGSAGVSFGVSRP